MSKNTPRDERRRIVRDWQSSGSTQRAYAEQHGLVLSSLRRWARELRDEQADVAEPAPLRFVEVKREHTAAPGALTLLRVTFEPDVTLEFDRLPEPAWLATFIGAAASG